MRAMTKVLALGLTFVATVAVAHEHVSNPTVKARMDAMQTIRVATGTLGDMLKGERPFEASIATQAKTDMAAASAEIVKLFTANEQDPASEAAPAIWENFDDFTVKAEAMVTAAEALDVASLEGLKTSFRDVGASCKACHESYRIEK